MENKILDNQLSILDIAEVTKVKGVTAPAEQEQQQEESKGFYIDSIEKASWVLKQLRGLNTKEQEIQRLATAEREQIDKWEKSESKAILEDKLYFEGLLKEYYKQQKAEDKKFKLSSPWGKVGTRKSKKWSWQDEEKIKSFIKENGLNDLIRTKEEINKADFKKIFPAGIDLETGEVIQGLTVNEVEEITVKVEA